MIDKAITEVLTNFIDTRKDENSSVTVKKMFEWLERSGGLILVKKCYECRGTGVEYPDPEDVPDDGADGSVCSVCNGVGFKKGKLCS